MAEALVSGIIKQLGSIAAQEIEQGVRLVEGVKAKVKKLTSNLQTIKAVLNDAEKRQVKEEAVQLWLDKLKDTSYDIEDVLNEWSTALLKLQIEESDNDNASTPKKKVCSFIPSPSSCFPQVNERALRHDIAHKIKNLNKTLDEITKERETHKFESNISGLEEIERPKNTYYIDVSSIYGRDNELVDLVNNLLGRGSQEERSPHIISICGMGGIGKTTLAQLAYNADEVKAYFDIKMWVCVSDPFDQMEVAKAIIQEAKGDSTNITELETLLLIICNLVEGKKFFLVLDDVWTEDREIWESFKLALTHGAQGSSILLTTRKVSVAMMVGSVCQFNLGTLSEDDCWFVFGKIAFYEKDEVQRTILEDLGRQIALRCKGLPLAAKTLGSLMRFKKTTEQWQDVLHSRVWELEEVERCLFAPILLSYFDLPSPVKRCYAYCAIFPKDHVFDREKMVKLWMAQGFLDSKRHMEMEITGQEYFEMLAMRSFFQDFMIVKNYESTIRCKMHDIVHDLAQELMKNECSSFENEELEANLKVRHLTLSLGKDMDFPTFVYKAQNLRTFSILDSDFNYQIVLPNLFRHLTYLRTLDLSEQSIKEIPLEVEKLIHLRYLDLSGNGELEELPEMMCILYNLQTLDVSRTRVDKLPKGIGRLINLRYLILDSRWTRSMKPFPKGFGRLSSLRTLKEFVVVGNEDSEGCKLGELKNLNCLRVEFEINGLGNLIEVHEAENAQLKKKIHLRKLTLSFNGEKNRRTENDEPLLNVLEPHLDLEVLYIKEYQGTTMFRNWQMLIKLKELVLQDCNKLEFLPHLGRLSFLKSLKILRAKSVKKVGDEFLGIELEQLSSSSLEVFPKLKFLEVDNLEEWEEWDGIGRMKEGEKDLGITIMPCLHFLNIFNCPKLKALPHFLQKIEVKKLLISKCPILAQRCGRETGEDWPKISHIPNINIDSKDVKNDISAKNISELLEKIIGPYLRT